MIHFAELAKDLFCIFVLSLQVYNTLLAHIGLAIINEKQLVFIWVQGTKTPLADKGLLLGAEELSKSIRLHI